MVLHEFGLYCLFSIASGTIGWFVHKVLDGLDNEIQQERKRIISAHVKGSHKTSLKTCTKDECVNLQNPQLLELQAQELSH